MAGIPGFFDGGDRDWPKPGVGMTSQRHPARLPWTPHDTDGVGPARSPRIPVLPQAGSRRRHKEMPRAGPARGGAILWTRIAFVRRRTRQRPGRTRHRMDPVGRTRSKRGDHGRKPPRRPRIGPSPRGAPARGGFSLRRRRLPAHARNMPAGRPGARSSVGLSLGERQHFLAARAFAVPDRDFEFRWAGEERLAGVRIEAHAGRNARIGDAGQPAPARNAR